MRRRVTLAEGRQAADELIESLVGFSVRKAIDPLTHTGFLLIGETISQKLAKAAEGAELEVLADAIEDLDLEWATLSESAMEAAFLAIQQSLTKNYIEKVIPSVGAILLKEGPAFMRLVRMAIKAHDKVDLVATLSQRDLKAEEAIRKSQLNYIRDSSGVRSEALSIKARQIVARNVELGLGNDQIVKDLKAQFEEAVPRPDSYWQVVADSYIGRARARSQIDAYVDADIDTYEIVATLDEVTTDICRFMHGKVFKVGAARKLLDDLDAMDDPENVRYAQPWVRKGVDDEGDAYLYVPNSDGSRTSIAKIERSGVGKRDDTGTYTSAKTDAELVALGIPCPPFHGRCRTVIVAGAAE